MEVSRKVRAGFVEEVVDPPPQQFDRLAFQFKLPLLVDFKYRFGTCAERTMIEKNDIRIKQELRTQRSCR